MSVPTGYLHGARQEARAARVEIRQEYTPPPGGTTLERAQVMVAHSNGTYDVDIVGDDGRARARVERVAPIVPATLEVGDLVVVAWQSGDDLPVILVTSGAQSNPDLGVLMY